MPVSCKWISPTLIRSLVVQPLGYWPSQSFVITLQLHARLSADQGTPTGWQVVSNTVPPVQNPEGGSSSLSERSRSDPTVSLVQ